MAACIRPARSLPMAASGFRIRPDLSLSGASGKPCARTFPLSSRIRTPGKPGNGPLHLTSHARHLDLELTAIALAEPQNVQFRYRLDPDSDWQALGQRRRLNFRALPPGRQRLEVEARYPHTDWLGPPAVLEFTADYRLQEHPAVRGLLLAILAAGLFGLWQRGRRRRQSL